MKIEAMGYPVVGYAAPSYQPRLQMSVLGQGAPSKPLVTLAEAVGLLIGIGFGVIGALEDSAFFGGVGASIIATSLFATIARAANEPAVVPA